MVTARLRLSPTEDSPRRHTLNELDIIEPGPRRRICSTFRVQVLPDCTRKMRARLLWAYHLRTTGKTFWTQKALLTNFET